MGGGNTIELFRLCFIGPFPHPRAPGSFRTGNIVDRPIIESSDGPAISINLPTAVDKAPAYPFIPSSYLPHTSGIPNSYLFHTSGSTPTAINQHTHSNQPAHNQPLTSNQHAINHQSSPHTQPSYATFTRSNAHFPIPSLTRPGRRAQR